MPSSEPTRNEPTEAATAGTAGVATPAGAGLQPTSRPRRTPHVRMTFDRVRQCHVLLAPEAILVLNPTGAAILALCDGQRTLAEITGELERCYDRVVAGEVARFLTRLATHGYMEIDDA